MQKINLMVGHPDYDADSSLPSVVRRASYHFRASACTFCSFGKESRGSRYNSARLGRRSGLGSGRTAVNGSSVDPAVLQLAPLSAFLFLSDTAAFVPQIRGEGAEEGENKPDKAGKD